jgi:hypothetical protein
MKVTCFLECLERKLPFRIKAIRINGGSEFKKHLEAACLKRKISLFLLPPRSPKHNGRGIGTMPAPLKGELFRGIPLFLLKRTHSHLPIPFMLFFDKIVRMSRTKSAPMFGVAAIVVLWLMSSCIRFIRSDALQEPAFVLEQCILCADLNIQNDWAEPMESKTTFKKGTDKNVFSFIQLKAVVGEHRIFWKWYDPALKLYRVTDPITIGREGQAFEKYIAWDQISLFEEKENGTWTVAVFMDDRLLASREFMIAPSDILRKIPSSTLEPWVP